MSVLIKMQPKATKRQQKELSSAYHNYGKSLDKHAFFKTHSRSISQDLVQDTFVKTWRYLVNGGKIDVMKAFLYHVLNNLIIDEYRKQKNKTISLDDLLEKGFEPSAGDHERVVTALDSKASLLLIKYLPPRYHVVMRMRYIQDLSIKEIALLTNQTKNAVAVQLHRGLIKLKLIYHKRLTLRQ